MYIYMKWSRNTLQDIGFVFQVSSVLFFFFFFLKTFMYITKLFNDGVSPGGREDFYAYFLCFVYCWARVFLWFFCFCLKSDWKISTESWESIIFFKTDLLHFFLHSHKSNYYNIICSSGVFEKQKYSILCFIHIFKKILYKRSV